MDILEEFLASSTIHGLIYISSAKVRLQEYLSLLFLRFRQSQEKFSGLLVFVLDSLVLES